MKTKAIRKNNALTRVRKYFPNVTEVVDAKESIKIEVLPKDNQAGRKKDPSGCALARACARSGKADGAIINIGRSYLIKGNVATRYITSVGVGREITSFDRHQDFAEGSDYILSKVPESTKLGAAKTTLGKKGGPKTTTKGPPIAVHKHHTSRIRVAKAK